MLGRIIAIYIKYKSIFGTAAYNYAIGRNISIIDIVFNDGAPCMWYVYFTRISIKVAHFIENLKKDVDLICKKPFVLYFWKK